MRKKEIPSQVTSIDLEGIMLSEIYKSDRERQILYANTYIWNLRGKKKRVMKNLVARRE